MTIKLSESGGPVEDEDRNELEATELRNYEDTAQSGRRCSTGVANSAGTNDGGNERLQEPRVATRGAAKIFWNRHVVATVSHDACRDHFALERTYLGYVRTSVALSIVGVVIAQLFRLQHSQNPDLKIGFFVLGIPLAALFIVAAIFVILLGACRFWRQQNAILRGKVHAGGWEVNAVGSAILIISLVLFVLVLAIDVKKG